MKWQLLVLVFLFAAAAHATEHVEEMLLTVSLPERYEKITAGEIVLVESNILLLRKSRQEPTDVIIEYKITDEHDVLITKATETKGAIVRIDTLKELRIPKDTPPGVYEITVTAGYGDVYKQSSVSFEVVEEKKELTLTPLWILALIFVLFFIVLLYIRHKFKKIEYLVGEQDLKKYKVIL